MFKRMKLQTRLLTIGILLTVVPVLVISGLMLWQNSRATEVAAKESKQMAYADLDHMVGGVYTMCETQNDVVQQNVDSSLNVARKTLNDTGKIKVSEEKVNWNAVNQYTKTSSTVTLPKMMVGDIWLGQNRDMNINSPIVDTVKELVGGTATIFQRMSDEGDMLRVCTNVMKKDGTRAIGTFIPAINPNGKPNPVISTVLRGQTFKGRAYVVNAWYITAYEPIYDADKNVTGILYVGVPQEVVASIRESIMRTVVGKTGYIFVLNKAGEYIISKDGKRDGQNIWDAKDDKGNFFVQEISKKALALDTGKIAEQEYPWKNPGDLEARMKISRIMYFEPWDWIIGAGSYESELYEAETLVKAIGHKGNMILAAVFIVSVLAAILIWFVVARGIGGTIGQAVTQLSQASDQVMVASLQIASSSHSLAEGAGEQASGLEETSSSLEEMASMTKQNADNAQQADGLMKEAGQIVGKANNSMNELTTSMKEISEASEETFKIIKTIDEIAFQTNLLALNAAVEAARAGEHGAGFAVVAEEVRNLAMRSADAAKNTSEMIEGTVKKVKGGSDLVASTNEAFTEMSTSVSRVGELVGEIAAASQEQSQGIDQVNKAVTEMDKVTQSNAANAEESASASEEMSAQAEQMKVSVGELATLIGGNGNGNGAGRKGYAINKKERVTDRKVFKGRKVALPGARGVRPDQIIPMEEGDFKDF